MPREKDLVGPGARRPRRWKCLQRPSARMILLPRATKLGYAMTLGRTGGLSRRRKLRPASSTYKPLVALVSPGSQGKSNRSLRSFVVAARDFSLGTQERFVNVLCDVWQAHFSSTPTGTLRPTNYFFPRTLTRPLSWKTTRVIHGKTTLGHNCVLKVFSVSLECQVY
jgi:hypothetical protein